MNVDKKYFDYVIDDVNKNFRIIKSSTKPKKSYAIETLTKIEHILKNNLTYDSTIQDNFSKYDKEELYTFLKNNAIHIQSKFKEKESKQFSIIKNEAKVNSLVKNIENFVEPSELFPLVEDARNELISHLSINDVGRLAQVNRSGKKFADSKIVENAKKFGFKEDINLTASQYLTQLFKEFRKLIGNNWFLIKYFENKKLSDALVNLSNVLPNLKLFKLLCIKDLYIKYPNIYPFLLKCTAECLEKSTLDKDKIDGHYGDEIESKSPIMEATHADKEEMVALLLKHGSNGNLICYNYGCTKMAPLHLASQNGSVAVAKILINRGADINLTYRNNETPLFFAVRYKQLEMVKFLLQHNARVNDITYSSLWIVINGGYFSIAELLFKYGTNPDYRDKYGNTFLNKATKENNLKVVQFLLNNNANPNIPSYHNDEFSYGSNDYHCLTPLQNAILRGYIDIAETLLKHKANMNILNKVGHTALTLAIVNNDLPMIQLLLNHGVEVNFKTSRTNPALYVANRGLFPNKKIIELLKENGAKEG